MKMHPGGNCLLLLCTITCMYFDYIHDQVDVYTCSYAAMLILQLSLSSFFSLCLFQSSLVMRVEPQPLSIPAALSNW